MTGPRLILAGLLVLLLLPIGLFSVGLHDSAAGFSATTMNLGNSVRAGTWVTTTTPPPPPAPPPKPPTTPKPGTVPDVVTAPGPRPFTCVDEGTNTISVTLRWLPPANATTETIYETWFSTSRNPAYVTNIKTTTTPPTAEQSNTARYSYFCAGLDHLGTFKVRVKISTKSNWGEWTTIYKRPQ
jgi:hypothetical protein